MMIHLFVSIVNRIANHLIQNRISKTTLSRRPRVQIQPAEGDLFHMELKLLRNAQEYSPNIVAVEICRVRPFSAYFSRACGSSKIGPLPLRSAGAANTANTLFTHTHILSFTTVSLLLALMADLCLPLSAGEDTFELHSVQLELEAVERRIRELLEKQAQLETSRADAHKSGVSMQRAANTPTTFTPCVSLHRPRAPGTRSSQTSFTPATGNRGPWVQQRKMRSRPRVTTSPPPVFEISSHNRFDPLCETERDAVIIGDSIVWHVRATLAEGNVHTHCFPSARVVDVSAQIPAILKDDESIAAVVIHAGVNDTKLQQTETLKRD